MTYIRMCMCVCACACACVCVRVCVRTVWQGAGGNGSVIDGAELLRRQQQPLSWLQTITKQVFVDVLHLYIYSICIYIYTHTHTHTV